MSKKSKARGRTPVQSNAPPASTAAPKPTSASQKAGRGLLIMIAVAVLLRLLYLGRADLWQDEMLLVMTSDIRKGMWAVLGEYWSTQMVSLGWLPLPAMIQNAFMSLVSTWVSDVMQDPFFTRVPGVVLGVIGVLGVYRMTRNRYEPWVHVAATLIAAATFYPVFYAREVHAYPLLLALAPWVIHKFTRCLLEPSPRSRDYIALGILTMLLAYTHLTAPMLVFALAVVAGVTWLIRMKKASLELSRQAGWTLIAVGVAGALVIPVFMKILGGESPHLRETSSLSAWFIVNDLVAKLFLGDLLIPTVVAWLVFLFGIASMVANRKQSVIPVVHVLLLVLAGLLILAAAKRTQYLSARYFAVVTPLVMVVFVQGFHAIAARMAAVMRKPQQTLRIAGVLFGLFLGIHLLLFLPPMYRLSNKSTDYGSIANWLNKNLPQGTPFVMESAYELRYVSGFYPTPGLVPAVPFVHGSDPADVDRLWERQEVFLRRFPESVLVESAHHRNQHGEAWPFPQTYFRRHVELRDDSLRSLVRMGIYGTFFRKDLTENSFVTRIHYNTRDDLKMILTAQGVQYLADYPGWQVAPLSPGVYARAHAGNIAQINLENLTGKNLRGRGEMVAMAYTEPAGETVNATVRVGDRRYGPYTLKGGVFTSMPIEGMEIPAAGQLLVWRIENDTREKVRALLVMDVLFTPDQNAAEISMP